MIWKLLKTKDQMMAMKFLVLSKKPAIIYKQAIIIPQRSYKVWKAPPGVLTLIKRRLLGPHTKIKWMAPRWVLNRDANIIKGS